MRAKNEAGIPKKSEYAARNAGGRHARRARVVAGSANPCIPDCPDVSRAISIRIPFADTRRVVWSALPSFTVDNPGYFHHPPPPFGMLKRQQLLVRPVEMVGDIGYLLVEPVEGVAYDSPGDSDSASKVCWQCGQTTVRAVLPSRLMRL